MLFYPGDLVTCTGDRLNYAVHEKFGRVGSDFFCSSIIIFPCYQRSLMAWKKLHRMYGTGVYWRFLYNQKSFNHVQPRHNVQNNLVPRVLSYPSLSRSVRRVGENPGNLVAYRTSMHNNNCGLRNIQHGVSTGRAHSTINETSSENRSVSATNICSRRLHERTRRGPTEVFLYPLLILLRDLLAGNYNKCSEL